MVDVLGLTSINMPKLGVNPTFWIYALIIFMFAITIAIVIFIVVMFKTYNKKIIVFENIAGRGFQKAFQDRARVIKLGTGGEELLYLKKKKVYRTAYGQKMGKNTYWFAIGQDGYWYNIILGDIDAKMGMLDIEPIDRDMRYMHVAIRKNIQDSYKSKNINTATAIVVGGIVVVTLILVIGGWFVMDKLAEAAKITNQNLLMFAEIQKATQQLLAAMDKISTTSGVIPA